MLKCQAKKKNKTKKASKNSVNKLKEKEKTDSYSEEALRDIVVIDDNDEMAERKRTQKQRTKKYRKE